MRHTPLGKVLQEWFFTRQMDQKLVMPSMAHGWCSKKVLKPTDKWFMELLLKFACKQEVQPVPAENRSQQELLELLEQTRSLLEQAELLVTPIVVWDGSEGEQEQTIIESIGLLVVAYEVKFFYFEILDMGRKLLLTAVLANFFSAVLSIPVPSCDCNYYLACCR